MLKGLRGRAGENFKLYCFMNWTTWIVVLIAWPLVGLGVAYLFGCYIHRVAESPENSGELVSPRGELPTS